MSDHRDILAHIRRTAAQARPQALPSDRLQGRGVTVDKGYWNGPAPVPVRKHMSVNNDRPILPISTGQKEPESTDPQQSVWFNTNCPPWVCPSYWSFPLDMPVVNCIPMYGVATDVGTVQVPDTWLYIIKGISYEALNGVQGDVFTFRMTVNGATVAEWEDIVADAAQPNPAYKFGIAGHPRPLPVHINCPQSAVIRVTSTLVGPLTLAGTSPRFSGEPIISADCHVKVLLNGWAMPARENIRSGARPTDLGDFGNLPLMDDLGGWQS